MLVNLKLDEAYDGFLFLAESARNPPSLRSHRHVELEINIVAAGAVTYIVEGERFSFGPRSLFWLFPAQEHQLVDRTADAQYYVAVFKPELIARACRGAVYRDLRCKKIKEGRVLHTALDPEAFTFLRQFATYVMQGSIDPDILNREAGFGFGSDFRYRHADPDGLNAGLQHLLLWAWRMQTAGGTTHHPVPLHPAVSKAVTLLGEEAWAGALSQLARRCGLSVSHLSRLFAQQVGVPLNRYRNSLRLARFWDCYHKPIRPTILEAAYAAGFGSYAQFFKVFTESYGQGPRQCLRSNPPDPTPKVNSKVKKGITKTRKEMQR